MNNVINFPIWKPQRATIEKIYNSMDKKISYKAFRSSSSGFISNKNVRKILINKFNGKCVLCDAESDFHIDHIKSVYFCFHNGLINFCNTEDNLQVLCSRCNLFKNP